MSSETTTILDMTSITVATGFSYRLTQKKKLVGLTSGEHGDQAIGFFNPTTANQSPHLFGHFLRPVHHPPNDYYYCDFHPLKEVFYPMDNK
ncbi:hypothetical protein TNCV_4409471 [Trichonephila clavipes]|nr:hypothetical protein TNCV_4409471 [Trichonephila clavipes]